MKTLLATTTTTMWCGLLSIAFLGGCSLMEKEFDTGSMTNASVQGDGLSGEADSEDNDDGRPGDGGTDPSDSDGGSDTDNTPDDSGLDDTATEDSGSTEPEEPGRVDCTPGVVPAVGNLDTCVSDVLTCGSSVVTTTDGGNSIMDADDYLAWFCTPFPDGEYIGPERTFNVTVPAGQSATFSLESPCTDLDIFALRWELWQSNDQCPDSGNSVLECEADDSRDGGEVTVYADPTRDTNYLVIVDSPDAQQQAFALDISCE